MCVSDDLNDSRCCLEQLVYHCCVCVFYDVWMIVGFSRDLYHFGICNSKVFLRLIS